LGSLVLNISHPFNGSLENGVRRCGLDASGSGQGPMAGCCEHGNEP